MSLLVAVPFLRGAVARSLPGGAPSLYLFHDGRMYARSPAILASYPTPVIMGTFAMAADDVEGAIDKLGAEPTIGAGDGTIVLRVGKRRSSIDLLDADPPDGTPTPDPTWTVPPSGLLDALRTAAPFVDDGGSWNRGVKLETGRVVALSSRSAIAVDVPDLAVEGQASLSDDAVNYLTKMRDPPDRWLLGPTSASFAWPSGAWVRCQLVAIPWPEGIFEKAMDLVDGPDVVHHGVVEVTDGFRESFGYVSSLGDGEVTIGPEGMVGRSAHGEHRDDSPIPLDAETRWTIRALKPVVAVADRWRPDAGGRARFEAKGLRGVVVGQQEK
jgi:hypothetical protein